MLTIIFANTSKKSKYWNYHKDLTKVNLLPGYFKAVKAPIRPEAILNHVPRVQPVLHKKVRAQNGQHLGHLPPVQLQILRDEQQRAGLPLQQQRDHLAGQGAKAFLGKLKGQRVLNACHCEPN